MTELTDDELLIVWRFNFAKTDKQRFLDIARAAIAADRALSEPFRPIPMPEGARTLQALLAVGTECAGGAHLSTEQCRLATDLLAQVFPGSTAQVPLSEPADGPAAVTSQTSDGYHTFEELYEHRHALFLALIKAAPDGCFTRSWKHNDGEPCFGGDEWFIVSGQLPGSPQISYHLPRCLWDAAAAAGATEVEQSGPWDGHTAVDVVNRLLGYAVIAKADGPASVTNEASPPPEGEVAELANSLRHSGDALRVYGLHAGADTCTRAADLLERQAAPVPVPVSERPWEREGWCGEHGRCWFGREDSDDWSADWTLATPDAIEEFCTYTPQTVCLPAHALPLPAQAGEVKR